MAVSDHSPVSTTDYEKLLEQNGVRRDHMRQPCSDRFIRQFSPKLGNWRLLHLLGDDTQIRVEEIERDFSCERERKHGYLRCWKQKYGLHEATYERLALGLLEAERVDLADNVCTAAKGIGITPSGNAATNTDVKVFQSTSEEEPTSTIRDAALNPSMEYTETGQIQPHAVKGSTVMVTAQTESTPHSPRESDNSYKWYVYVADRLLNLSVNQKEEETKWLRECLQKKEEENKQLRDEKQQLRDEKQQLRDENKQLWERLLQNDKEKQEILEKLNNTKEMLKKIGDENEKLKEQLKDEKEKHEADLASKEQELFNLQEQKDEQLSQVTKTLQQQIEQTKAITEQKKALHEELKRLRKKYCEP